MEHQGKEEDVSSTCRKWGEFRRYGSTSNCSLESNISLGISRAGLAKYGQPYTPLEKISTVSVWMRQWSSLLCIIIIISSSSFIIIIIINYYLLYYYHLIHLLLLLAVRRRTTLVLATGSWETKSNARTKTCHATESCKEKGDQPGSGHARLCQEEEVSGRRELDKEL